MDASQKGVWALPLVYAAPPLNGFAPVLHANYNPILHSTVATRLPPEYE